MYSLQEVQDINVHVLSTSSMYNRWNLFSAQCCPVFLVHKFLLVGFWLISSYVAAITAHHDLQDKMALGSYKLIGYKRKSLKIFFFYTH